MKLYNCLIIFGLTALLFSCSSGQKNHTQETDIINYDSLHVINKKFSSLKELGKITRAINLETTENSLFGSLERVIVEPKNDDILVGDFSSGKRVLRFSGQGKFITSYGRVGAGPGEYMDLMNFAITANGDVVILSNMKLIKYSKEGTLLLEVRIDFHSNYIEIIDDLVYIYVTSYRRSSLEKPAILIFNTFLVEVGGIGKYDDRLEKYRFLAWNTLSKYRNNLYFTDLYDLNLNIYDTKTKKLSRLVIPTNNSQLASIFGKTNLSQADNETINKKIHRFIDIFGFDNRLLLIEHFPEERKFTPWLLSLEKKEILVFNLESLYRDYRVKSQKELLFDRVIGSYDKGVIGIFSDEAEFNQFKAGYPILHALDFKMDDNPIVAFFQFNSEK